MLNINMSAENKLETFDILRCVHCKCEILPSSTLQKTTMGFYEAKEICSGRLWTFQGANHERNHNKWKKLILRRFN